ncbi:MAG: hypothetical protein RCG15_09000 [Candidatus Rickettsia vulgarisii]
MIKRLLFLYLLLIIHNAYSSAWLINKGKYRYILTTSNIDKNSKHLKQIRTNLHLKLEEELESLRTELKLINNKSSAQYKILFQHIKALEKQVLKLIAYQDHSTKTFTIEYDINKNHNLGIQLFYKNYETQDNKHQSTT